MGKRLLVAGLAVLLVVSGLVPVGTLIAQAVIPVDWGQTIDTSLWSPNAPGPSGVAWRPETGTLIVVDTDKGEEVPWDGTNMWEIDPVTGAVVYSVALDTDGEDATGVAYDAATQTLFVSNDGPNSAISVFETAGDGQFTGTRVGLIDTAALIEAHQPGIQADTEDPAYDPNTQRLFFLNGATAQVFQLDSTDGNWGDDDDILDTTTPVFTVPGSGADPLDDWEGLAFDGTNLLIGAKEDPVIHISSTTGVLVDTIDLQFLIDDHGMWEGVHGLGVQPGVGEVPETIWVADRGDSVPPTTNDGKLHRVYDPTTLPAQTQENPVLAPITTPMDADEGVAFTFKANGGDPDLGDTITYSLVGAPAGAAINPANGVFTWTPTEAQGPGPYNMTVRVTDQTAKSASQAVTINVAEVNQAPVAVTPANQTGVEASAFSLQLSATDPDVPANTLTWSAIGLPFGLGISSSGLISGTLAAGTDTGSPYTVTATVTDNGTPALNDQAQFSLTVLPEGSPPPPPPDDDNPFIDDDGHIFENAIEWLAAEGITSGCNPPLNNMFCPNDNITRGQMAAFLVRAFGYSAIARDFFTDDSGNIFENAINRLATAGDTQGCNPPTNDRYCPGDNVTRGQMAAFIARAFDLPAYNGPDVFVDDDNSVFEGAIERLAQAGITLGCNPPTNDRYCPTEFVTRGQMAAFLKRAFGE